MSTIVVVGAQWGDEGKGKVVDVLAAEADIVARFAGGNNAGHTLVVDGEKLITHLVPSGCRYPGTQCVLGAGMVIDPDVFANEVAELQRHGLLLNNELRVSAGAHLILDFHRVLDGLREDRAVANDNQIGTTRRGVGPAYESKAARRGIRVRDLYYPKRLRERLEQCRAVLDPELERLGVDYRIDVEKLVERGQRWGEWMKGWVCDAGALCQEAVDAGRPVLFEGAQGAMLDVDHGTYPFVTSSNAIAGGVCTGMGIGPTHIDKVWGITKAYTTRVGAGPFPSKLEGDIGETLRQAGMEFGATTGRPRDCGWLDLPALRYAARVNGMTGLCVTKLDVLAAMPAVHVCVGYSDGLDPGLDDLEGAQPVLEKVDGWGDQTIAQIQDARRLEDLPQAARRYIDLIEQHIGVPVVMVSVGPDRDQTITLAEPF